MKTIIICALLAICASDGSAQEVKFPPLSPGERVTEQYFASGRSGLMRLETDSCKWYSNSTGDTTFFVYKSEFLKDRWIKSLPPKEKAAYEEWNTYKDVYLGHLTRRFDDLKKAMDSGAEIYWYPDSPIDLDIQKYITEIREQLRDLEKDYMKFVNNMDEKLGYK